MIRGRIEIREDEWNDTKRFEDLASELVREEDSNDCEYANSLQCRYTVQIVSEQPSSDHLSAILINKRAGGEFFYCEAWYRRGCG